MSENTRSMMKWPLIVAAVLVVVRMVLEQAGAPEAANNIFGVAWLYFLVPVYFAYQIGASGAASPFKALFKKLLLFTIYTRLMIMPTYWLAYRLQWEAPRFSLELGGVVGDDVTALSGYLLIPVRNLLIWVGMATVIGMVLGSITLWIRRRKPAAKESA